jgi:hypothetical protein
VSKTLREAIADWLMLLGAAALLVSLFLVWSHQAPPRVLALHGVPRNPTAWQVYSVADVLLALVAAGLVFVAFLGTRPARIVALAAAGTALAFVVRASDVAPTNGLNLPALMAAHARSGTGEVVALVGLGVALAGLAVSFTAD